MGDRNNPIKFGPEWLRNLAREGNTGGSVNGPNPTNSGISPSSGSTGSIQGSTYPTGSMSLPGPPGAVGVMGSSGGTAAQGVAGGSSSSNVNAAAGVNSRNSTNNNVPKVLLAKSRYGREEMLALYDRSAEAPEELKYFDLLYQPRGKRPVALNNTFEEEMRDNIRGGPPIGAMAPVERFGLGRGMGRGSGSENRGRTRMPFVRQTSSGRGNSWHMGNTRLPGYNSATEEDTNPLRPWGASNGNNPSSRVNNEQPEWNPNKVFRRRQANNTNWRQPHTRDEGDEWRSSDAARNRPNTDKWDREWGERPAQDRPQSWNSSRRTWVGGEGNNDDNLPEWAVDSAEAGAGTFDSTGAFHGYSNDDSNLPKTQDSSFPLVRSHTHGSFVRSKTVEEGSEEWWASEKAKKLSQKKFESSDIKFKKSPNDGTSEANTSTISTQNSKDKDKASNDSPENSEKTATVTEPSENTNTSDDKKLAFKPKFSESKTFDSLMRSDIDMEDVCDERGNFQSVMITTNNSLRQKHQNIVASVSENTSRQGRIPALQMLHTMSQNDNDSRQTPEEKLVEDIFDLTLEDAKISTSCVTSINSNNSSAQPDHRLSSGGMPMSIPSPGMPTHGLTMSSASTMSTSVLQGATLLTPSMQTGGLHAAGMQPVGLQTGVIQTGVMQTGSMQQGGMQQRGMQPGGLQSGGMQPSGIQGGILQPGAMQPGGIQALQAAGLQTSGMPTPGLQNVGIPNSALNSSLGISLGSANNGLLLPMQGVQPSVMSNTQLSNPGLGAAGLQARGSVLPGFQPSSGLSVITGANVANTSLFLGQNNNPQMQSTNDIQIQGHGAQTNLFPMYGLHHSGSQGGTFGSIYSNIIPPTSTQPAQNSQNLADQWYYEDPKKIIQGPFSSKEMYNWYRAGFFSPSLMVRRACDAHMRPLGSYGPMVPFAQIDMLSPFPMSSGFETRTQGPHLLNQQQGLGLDDSLWSQPTPSPDLMWMKQAMNARNESRVNHLPMFFWDPQGEHFKEK